MRWPPTPIQSRVERLATGLLGASFLTSAALSAGLARDHMALRGVICGVEQVPHCGWCYTAAALALAGLAAWVTALSPAGSATEPGRRSTV